MNTCVTEDLRYMAQDEMNCNNKMKINRNSLKILCCVTYFTFVHMSFGANSFVNCAIYLFVLRIEGVYLAILLGFKKHVCMNIYKMLL